MLHVLRLIDFQQNALTLAHVYANYRQTVMTDFDNKKRQVTNNTNYFAKRDSIFTTNSPLKVMTLNYHY